MTPFVFLSLLFLSGIRSEPCVLDLDSESSWPAHPPILTDYDGALILPDGERGNRSLQVRENQVFLLGCPLTEFVLLEDVQAIFGQCQGANRWDLFLENGTKWEVEGGLGEYGCVRRPDESVRVIGQCGPGEEGTEIQIDFDITESMEGEAVTIKVCHDLTRSSSIWARHTLWDEIDAKDTGYSAPSFKDDDFFDFDIDNYYKMATQRDTIADLVGSSELADQYIQGQSTGLFLSRGHLAPTGDFIFKSWMDSSYHFVNAAPQWQSFNGGNWAQMEGHARDLAVEKGLDLVVYTGTHGVLQLHHVNGALVDIFLYDGLPDSPSGLPVPMYFWKILYDPETGAGVALIGLNNPHWQGDPASFQVCPPLLDHPLITSISDPTDVKKGAMWACRVEDLSAVFPEIPPLPPLTLLE